MRLLSPSRDNLKLRKSERVEFRILGLSLSPGGPSICPSSTESCRISCVGGKNVGMASFFPAILASRQRKTDYFLQDRPGFLARLRDEISHEQQEAENDGEQLVLRLNTFSDLDWSTLASDFPDVRFYDYSKVMSRFTKIVRGTWPTNYHITFSWSERSRNQADCVKILQGGGNVAIPFAELGRGFCGAGAYRQRLPGFWRFCGQVFPVQDGDLTDLRFLDNTSRSWNTPRPGAGWIVGLRLKSANEAARNQSISSGFSLIFRP